MTYDLAVVRVFVNKMRSLVPVNVHSYLVIAKYAFVFHIFILKIQKIFFLNILDGVGVKLYFLE